MHNKDGNTPLIYGVSRVKNRGASSVSVCALNRRRGDPNEKARVDERLQGL
jgi:hypothetical protein